MFVCLFVLGVCLCVSMSATAKLCRQGFFRIFWKKKSIESYGSVEHVQMTTPIKMFLCLFFLCSTHTGRTLLGESNGKEKLNLHKNWWRWLLHFKDSFIFGAEIGFRYCSGDIVKEDHSEVVRWRGANRRCHCFFFEQCEANNLFCFAIPACEQKIGPELLKWKPLIMVSFVRRA